MSQFVNTIDKALKEKHISRNKMLTDLGLNKNSMVDWEKRGTIPKATVVSSIAEYLDVPFSTLFSSYQNNEKAAIPHIEIITSGTTTHIFIDGKELNGVRKVSFTQDASEASGIPILQLQLDASDMTLNVKRIPELPDVFKSWYVLNDDYDNTSGESL